MSEKTYTIKQITDAIKLLDSSNIKSITTEEELTGDEFMAKYGETPYEAMERSVESLVEFQDRQEKREMTQRPIRSINIVKSRKIKPLTAFGMSGSDRVYYEDQCMKFIDRRKPLLNNQSNQYGLLKSTKEEMLEYAETAHSVEMEKLVLHQYGRKRISAAFRKVVMDMLNIYDTEKE